MESLEIRNFLTIREAKLDVRPFTLLIGPQASGKSVIAKVLYFFRDFLNSQFINSIGARVGEDELRARAISKFEEIFPRYSWADQDFELTYTTDDFTISVSWDRREPDAPVQLRYSEELADLHRRGKSAYDTRLAEMRSPGNGRGRSPDRDLRSMLYDALNETIYRASAGRNFRRSVFIPASRSFFATLQKNVFSLLANDIAIDPLIKDFGLIYETSKTFLALDQNREPLLDEIESEMEEVLAGRYIYEEDQDWIFSNGRRINLANASSGQQEALPMLLVLLDRVSWLDRSHFFIEEPEAHLFPVAQKKVIGIFGRLYNAQDNQFVLTTHSPYILSALNNLILAANVIQERGPEVTPQIHEIIGGERVVPFKDVSAYTVRDGRLESILDEESRLIGASVIDSVSDEFAQVFDRLLEIETA